MKRIRNESLLSHGKGPYRAIAFCPSGDWLLGFRLRFSWGAYGYDRSLFSVGITNYPLTATHLHFGHGAVSFIWAGSMGNRGIVGTNVVRYRKLRAKYGRVTA